MRLVSCTRPRLRAPTLSVSDYVTCLLLLCKNISLPCVVLTPCRGVHGVRHIPFALLPTPFPASQYHKAVAIQRAFNTLMHAVRSDATFLTTNLKAAADVDDFTARLLALHETVVAEGVSQSISLSIHRSDYMLHSAKPTDAPVIKQVEVNTISAAFGSLTTTTAKLHHFVFSRFGLGSTAPEVMPPNETVNGIVAGIAQAVRMYSEKYSVAQPAVVMVVQPEERNSLDQRGIEFGLWEWHGIKLLRRSLKAIDESAVFGPDHTFSIDGHEVTPLDRITTLSQPW